MIWLFKAIVIHTIICGIVDHPKSDVAVGLVGVARNLHNFDAKPSYVILGAFEYVIVSDPPPEQERKLLTPNGIDDGHVDIGRSPRNFALWRNIHRTGLWASVIWKREIARNFSIEKMFEVAVDEDISGWCRPGIFPLHMKTPSGVL